MPKGPGAGERPERPRSKADRIDTDTLGLLAAARDGDRAALEALLVELEPVIRRFLERRISRASALYSWVDDVTQVSLLRITRSITSCRATSPEQLAGWVLTIARRATSDISRSNFPHHVALVVATDPAVGDQDHDESRAPEDEVTSKILASLLSDLAKHDSELLYARTVLGDPYRDLSQRLGISEQAARMRYHRILPRLKKEFIRRTAHLPEALRKKVLRRLALEVSEE